MIYFHAQSLAIDRNTNFHNQNYLYRFISCLFLSCKVCLCYLLMLKRTLSVFSKSCGVMFFEEASESSRLTILIHTTVNHIDFHIQTPLSLSVNPSLCSFLVWIRESCVYSLDVLQILGLQPSVCVNKKTSVRWGHRSVLL